MFKHFKNPYHHAVQPQFHFICLSALLLSQALWKKAREAGYNFSIETMIDKLTEVRKVELITLTGLKGKPAKETRLEDIETGLLKLYQELDK